MGIFSCQSRRDIDLAKTFFQVGVMEVISPLSLRFNNHILRADDGKFLVKGFTLHAVINSRGHLAKLPADIFSLLNSLI